MQWIVSEMGVEYASGIDQVLIEKARADALPDFKNAVDQIPGTASTTSIGRSPGSTGSRPTPGTSASPTWRRASC